MTRKAACSRQTALHIQPGFPVIFTYNTSITGQWSEPMISVRISAS